MIVNIMNQSHWPVKIGNNIFYPFEEVNYNAHSSEMEFRQIRSNKNLRVGKYNNAAYKKKHGLKTGYKFNMCYDIISQHAGAAYKYAIEALANPILKHLKKDEYGYTMRPLPGPKYTGINCRFFSSMRINQQGKIPVGPRDVFISHGVADKDYWIGKRIQSFKYAFCPGPAWEKRMRDTGYKGEIFQVGYTKLDPLINGEIERNIYDKPVIAWLPTHGYANKHKGRSSYPAFLRNINDIPENKYILLTGQHPTTKMHKNIKQLPTINQLIDADVVIADAGSTLYEAWMLGKPVIFPDWICKKDVLSHFNEKNFEYQIYKRGIGYHAKDMKQLLNMVDIALQNGIKNDSKEFINEIYPENIRGQSGELSAKALIEISKTKVLI